MATRFVSVATSGKPTAWPRSALRHFLERLFIDVKITGAGEHTYAACRTKK
ncbi:MAG TPA: hypothetical protein VLC09_05525 [Polyangiaceae bacterium]|nr:hypothetical protein [Polyangiaceae bacterium]